MTITQAKMVSNIYAQNWIDFARKEAYRLFNKAQKELGALNLETMDYILDRHHLDSPRKLFSPQDLQETVNLLAIQRSKIAESARRSGRVFEHPKEEPFLLYSNDAFDIIELYSSENLTPHEECYALQNTRTPDKAWVLEFVLNDCDYNCTSYETYKTYQEARDVFMMYAHHARNEREKGPKYPELTAKDFFAQTQNYDGVSKDFHYLGNSGVSGLPLLERDTYRGLYRYKDYLYVYVDQKRSSDMNENIVKIAYY